MPGGGGERGGRDLAQAGDRADEFRLVPPVVIALDELLDLGFEVIDRRVEPLQHGLDAALRQRRLRGLPAVRFDRTQVDELPPPVDQLLQRGLVLMRFDS